VAAVEITALGPETSSEAAKGAAMAPVIVIAIDEDTDPGVARVAGQLAAGLGSRVVLVHVAAREQVASARGRLALERTLRRGHETMYGFRRELPDDVDVGQRVDFGPTVETLCEILREEQAELLVVGSRGRGRLASTLLGSVSRSLARRAPCPVTIINPHAAAPGGGRSRNGGPPRLVSGVDGSERSLAAARLASSLASRLGYRLILVHARHPAATIPAVTAAEAERAATTVVERALAAVGGDAEGRIESAPPASALQSVADREGARAIVVGVRGGHALRGPNLLSVSTQLLGRARCPVIVVAEPTGSAGGEAYGEVHRAA
jgi:nucleotide-binding universal stress UspA family protein